MKFFKQLDQMDCGTACIQMIAHHYGKFYSLNKLRELCNINREGVSILGISNAAEHIGFHTLAGKIDFDNLKNGIKLPCIIHWKQNHFIILSNITRRKVIIIDPGVGIMEIPKSDFLMGWTGNNNDVGQKGICLLLDPQPAFFSNKDESYTNSNLQNIFRYLRPHKKYFIRSLF